MKARIQFGTGGKPGTAQMLSVYKTVEVDGENIPVNADPVARMISKLAHQNAALMVEKYELDGSVHLTTEELYVYGHRRQKPWRACRTAAALGKMLVRLKVPRVSGGRGKGNVATYRLSDVERAFQNRTITPRQRKKKIVSPIEKKKKRR